MDKRRSNKVLISQVGITYSRRRKNTRRDRALKSWCRKVQDGAKKKDQLKESKKQWQGLGGIHRSRVWVMVMVLVNWKSIRRISCGFSSPRGRGFGLGLKSLNLSLSCFGNWLDERRNKLRREYISKVRSQVIIKERIWINHCPT